MKRTCTNCQAQYKSHTLVVEERDYCSKLCRCKNVHGGKGKDGKPKKSSCGVCTPAVKSEKRRPQVRAKTQRSARKGRAVLVM